MGFRAGPFLTEQAISHVSGWVSRSRCLALPTLWLAALGLDPTLVNSQPRTYSVRDSAGITIIENRAPLWQPGGAWRFAASPSVQIGQVDGDSSLLLTNIRAATRLSDGRVAVAQTGHVRYFGPDGRFLRYVGRAGRGPGEFVSPPTQLRVLSGDSLGATSVYAPEFVFDGSGTFVRSIRFDADSLSTATHMVGRATMIADGTRILTIFERTPTPKPPPGIVRSRETYVRFDPVTLRRDTLGTFPGAERVGQPEGQRAAPAARPYSRSTMFAGGGDRLYIADSDGNAFHVFSTATWPSPSPMTRPGSGIPMQLRAIVRKPVTLEPVTAADRSAWIERARAPFSSMQGQAATARNPERMQMERDYLEQSLANANWPATKPAFAALVADRVGNLWIQDHARFGEALRYTVIDREGRWLGAVTAPPGVTVLEIGADYMLGVWKNPDDVEFLRVYPLIKR